MFEFIEIGSRVSSEAELTPSLEAASFEFSAQAMPGFQIIWRKFIRVEDPLLSCDDRNQPGSSSQNQRTRSGLATGDVSFQMSSAANKLFQIIVCPG